MNKVLIVVLLSLCFGLNAQKLYHSQHLRFENITIEDGLPGNSAHAFMQDRLGYIWMGTFNGLVRYDGINFTVFKEKLNENSLKGKFITDIFEDSAGKIWIGSMFHGLNCYEPKTGHFTHFPYDPKKENSLIWSYVTSINEDKLGRIWVSTTNGLNYLEKNVENDDYKIHSFYPSIYTEPIFNKIYEHIEKYPTISLDKVGKNAKLNKKFIVEENTTALIVQEGEYAGLGKFADHGWITDQNGSIVWQPEVDQSHQDGANYKKRFQIETKELPAGTYQLHYESDEDFSYEDFYYPNEIRPFDQLNRIIIPEHDSLLWGIKVILLPKSEGELMQKMIDTEIIPFDHTVNNSRIYTLFKDNANELWIGSAGGLSQILIPEADDQPIRFKHLKVEPSDKSGFHLDVVSQIQQKDDHTFWIAGMTFDENKNFGLAIESYQPENEKFTTIYKNPEITNYTQFLELPDKSMWLASFGDGLFNLNYRPNTKNPYNYVTQKYALPNDFSWQLFKDNSGIIWAGTWQAGAFKLNSSVNIFPFYVLKENTNIKKEELAIISILEDSKGNLWLGTRGIGLYKWDRKTHLFSHFEKKDGLIDGSIRCMEEDRQGNIWIGTNNGVNRFDPETKKFSKYYHNKNSDDPDVSLLVLDIKEDDRGRIWLGTGEGLCLYQPEKDKFEMIFISDHYTQITTERINRIEIDSEGNLWLAYYFEGIIKVNADEVADQLQIRNIERFSNVKGVDLIDMLLENDRYLWLGDHQIGLQRLDIETGEIKHYRRTDKDDLNNVTVMIEDKRDNLWLSNSTGLSVFNKKDLSFKNFTKEDGIDFDFAEPGPSIMTKRGEFLIGGINGFYLFHPDEITAPSIPPTVVFTDFKLFNKSLEEGPNEILEQHISYTDEIQLNYKQNTVAISYAGLHFDKPKSIQYTYQLEGVDENWMNVGEEKIARYANLAPGSYLFKVKAANRGGGWNPNMTTLKINISPPWWKTIWFYILAGLFIIVTVYLFYNFQLTRQIERSEAQRLKDLDEMKSRFFVNVAHELRTPLTLILGPLSSITKRGGLDGRTLTDLKLMRSNGNLLLRLINEILELSRLEANKIELKEKPTQIYPLMHRSIAAFESGAQYRDIQLTFIADFDKRLQLMIDVPKFEKILFNLIINALKFTHKGGKVTIYGHDTGSQIQIKVEDTGQGIHKEDLPLIFDRFYQTSRPHATNQGGTGVGLALSKQFAQVLGGDIIVESVLGKGSTFIFSFPKNEVFGVAKDDLTPEDKALGEDVTQDEFDYQEDTPALVMGTTDHNEKSNRPRASILIVEDNPDMQIYIKSILADNYNVTVVENGKEALSYLYNKNDNGTLITNPDRDTVHELPSLIISDVMMPIMNGFTLLKKIKSVEEWLSIPVIMLTARIEKEDRLRALRIGVDDYLTKPFEQDELLIRIENLLNNYYKRKKVVQKAKLELPEKNNEEPKLKTSSDQIKTSKEDLEWLENLEQVIQSNVNDAQFTVTQLALDLHISERQIYRKIKKLTGLSPNNYLREIRLQKARTMLENNDCSSVKEACYSVGFRKVGYFSKIFQERFGKLPSELL